MYPLIIRAIMRTVLVIFFRPEEIDEPRLTAVRSIGPLQCIRIRPIGFRGHIPTE